MGGGGGGGATNEDFLDNFFSSGASSSNAAATSAQPTTASTLPGMPEGRPWADFGTVSAINTATTTAVSPKSTSASSPRKGAISPSRFSPGWQAATTTTTTGGATFNASPQPTSTSSPSQQVVGNQVGNPFIGHRRGASQASSHHRTLSSGSDPWSSMPTTPSRIDGPERVIAAAFVAEMDGELSVAVGERVKVHSEMGGWARVMRMADAKAGLVPSWSVGLE